MADSPPPKTERGQALRQAAFIALHLKYQAPLLEAIDVLRQLEFDFLDIAKAHVDQLRPELLFRQSLPFFITEETFFGSQPTSSKVLASLLAGHTLALTHLDYHLDGCAPTSDDGATARQMDLITAISYTVRVLYAAGRIANEAEGGANLFRDALDPVSGFVVLRMYQDWRERYSEVVLRRAKQALQEYLSAPTSRLLASGYWELMVRGAFSSHGASPPTHLIQIVQKLRMLRQLVDEIADFDEDVTAGLITAPLLFALAGSARPGDIETLVLALWKAYQGSEDRVAGCMDELRELVAAEGGFDRAGEHAHSLCEQGVQMCQESIGSKASGFLLLLDLKRAKLAELT